MHAVHFWGQGNTQHRPFVYGQNKICLARPYFILGQMLIFPFPFPSFSVTGRAPSDQVSSFSLVLENELHAWWCHKIVFLQGGLVLKKQSHTTETDQTKTETEKKLFKVYLQGSDSICHILSSVSTLFKLVKVRWVWAIRHWFPSFTNT